MRSDLDLAVVAGAALLLVAVVAVRLSRRTGLPSLLVYLALGVAVGEAGLGVPFDDVALTETLGLLALAVILAEGGLSTRWDVIRPALPLAAALSLVGVLVSVAVVAAVGHLLLGLEVRSAVLLGAVVSSTDVAAVFSVLRDLPLRRSVVATLEGEAGFNDPPVVLLVALVLSDAWDEAGVLSTVGAVLYQLGVGALVGVAIGRAGQSLLSRLALPAAGLYPLATMALALLAFGTAGLVGASGFLATYVAALWLGNAQLPHRVATLGFAEGLAWVAQIGLFVMLGLLASPERLPAALLPALAVGGTLLLLARPLSVVVCATPFRVPWREQAFLSWAGLRGAVPIVLAAVASGTPLPGVERLFDVVFVLVVVFTVIQAPLLPPLARWLGVAAEDEPQDMAVESAPLEGLDAALLDVLIPAGSNLAGVYVAEMRLPPGAAATLVVRAGRSLVPTPETRLQVGDHLAVVTTPEARAETEQRLRDLAREGRLASWYATTGEAATPDDGAGVRWRQRALATARRVLLGRRRSPPRS